MKKFLVIYYAPAEVAGKMATATPEEKAAGLGAWMAWKAKHDNHIVDFGAPLMPGESRSAAATWAQSNKEVSGFSIVQGNDLESVKAIFDDHPHLNWGPGCSVGVYEYIPM